MDYKLIIEEILEVYNLNASEFAEKIDVQRSSISHILSGRNKPSLDFLTKIKESFPELRWDYLLLGKRPMTISEENLINKKEEKDDIIRDKNSPMDIGTPLLLFEQTEDLSDNVDENKENNRSQVPKLEEKAERKVKKIVWFYEDNTFEVFEN